MVIKGDTGLVFYERNTDAVHYTEASWLLNLREHAKKVLYLVVLRVYCNTIQSQEGIV